MTYLVNKLLEQQELLNNGMVVLGSSGNGNSVSFGTNNGSTPQDMLIMMQEIIDALEILQDKYPARADSTYYKQLKVVFNNRFTTSTMDIHATRRFYN